MEDESNLKRTLVQIQDHLCPMLDAYEQMLYHYLFRLSHLEGKQECLVGTKSLRHKVGLGTGVPGHPPSEEQIRVKIRSLEKKGIIELLDRSREGTLIKILTPEQIPGCVPSENPSVFVDIESIDFLKPPYRKYILSREVHKCFYCFRELKDGKYELDHVIPSANGGNNSYRNLVASCLVCNNSKGDKQVEDFLRTLYRNGILSNQDFQGRLEAVTELQNGSRVPPIAEALE